MHNVSRSNVDILGTLLEILIAGQLLQPERYWRARKFVGFFLLGLHHLIIFASLILQFLCCSQIMKTYAAATSGAIFTAVSLNQMAHARFEYFIWRIYKLCKYFKNGRFFWCAIYTEISSSCGAPSAFYRNSRYEFKNCTIFRKMIGNICIKIWIIHIPLFPFLHSRKCSESTIIQAKV